MDHEQPVEAIVTLDIDADVEDVWRALTTADGLAAWMGADSFVGDAVGDDLHFADITTGDVKRGIVDERTPLVRLGYTWWSERDPEASSQVAIDLEQCETGTRVTVTETQCGAGHAEAATMSLASTGDRLSTGCDKANTRCASWSWRTALLLLASQAMISATVQA